MAQRVTIDGVEYVICKDGRKMKASSIDALKPRKKGDPCIYRGGRPKKEATFSDVARGKAWQKCDRPDAKGRTWIQYLVDKCFEHAADNPVYLKELLDRMDGKVVQTIQGNVTTDVNFVIGRGYANGEPDVSTDKQTTA